VGLLVSFITFFKVGFKKKTGGVLWVIF